MSNKFRKLQKEQPWGMIVAAGLAVILILAVVIYFAINGFPVLEKPGGKERAATTSIHESKEFKYRFTFPKSGWKQDNDTRLHLKANCLAMKRSNPQAWFALAARDFKNHAPNKEEVTKEAVNRLEGYFKEVEWDPAPDGFLAEKPAWILVFQGKAENTQMRGECHMVAYKGMVYWFTTWCSFADAGALATEWPKIREGFGLLEGQSN
jgi:hypothetical protein